MDRPGGVCGCHSRVDVTSGDPTSGAVGHERAGQQLPRPNISFFRLKTWTTAESH